MSYDLKLFRVPEGADPSLLFQESMAEQDRAAERPPSAEARAEIERIANILKSWRPSLEEFRPPSPLPWIELNDPDLPIQFEVYDRHVFVTMPYFGDNARELMDCVIEACETLRAAAGYLTYDPQLGRLVTAADLQAMVAQYREVDRLLPEIRAASEKPWWKFW